MPFGMCNAPATFQRLVNIVFADVPNCTAYLDDVVIHSSTWSDHLSTLKRVFQWLENASLTLNLAKCEFGKATVRLREAGGTWSSAPSNWQSGSNCCFSCSHDSPPVAQIPGDGRVLDTFFKNYSTVVAPLTSMLSPKVPFTVPCESIRPP